MLAKDEIIKGDHHHQRIIMKLKDYPGPQEIFN